MDIHGESDNSMHPVGIPPPFVQSDVAGNNNECDEVTLRPQGDVKLVLP
jgi:hypothetical protein